MRIIISSMPMIALVAILSASANRRLERSAMSSDAHFSQALPEAQAIIKKVRFEAAKHAASRPMSPSVRGELAETESEKVNLG